MGMVRVDAEEEEGEGRRFFLWLMGPGIKCWNFLKDFYFFSFSRYDGRYVLTIIISSQERRTNEKSMMKISMKMQMKIKIMNMNMNINVNTSIHTDVKMKMKLNMNMNMTMNNEGVTYLCQSRVLVVLQLKRIY